MDRQELQRLRDLPVEGVAERLGLQVTRHKALCPFHDDHHASLSFNVRRNTCRCFVCMNESIGTIDLVMRQLHMGFPDACRWLADEHNVIFTSEYAKAASAEKMQKPFDAHRYEGFFERPWLSAQAKRFLFDERKLDGRVVRWCRLTSWTDGKGIHWLQIPYFDTEGKLIGIQNRNLSSSSTSSSPSTSSSTSTSSSSSSSTSTSSSSSTSTSSSSSSSTSSSSSPSTSSSSSTSTSTSTSSSLPRFRFPQGSACSIYNLPVVKMLKEGEPLYITEGCSDCWAMLSAGHKAIAIPSATLLKTADIDLLLTLTSRLSTPLHMFPDQDVPGERLFLQLKERLPKLQRHLLPAGCKDFSDFYIATKKGGMGNG